MTPIVSAGRPRLHYSTAATAVTIDGNSIPAGSYPTGGAAWVNTMLGANPPINAQFTVSNVAISGQQWPTMTSAHTDVNAAWQSGKTNVLIPWETTNYVRVAGATGAQCVTAAAAYIAACRTVHPWKGVLVTATPVRIDPVVEGDTQLGMNQRIDDANALFRANWRTMGFDALADIRQPGSPYNFDYTNSANFTTTYYAKQDGSDTGGQIAIHLADAGFIYASSVINAALRRVPR